MKPIGFMSYVQSVNEHDGGKITQLCKLLSNELEAQSGEAFDIFQDRSDMKYGQNWRARIVESINGSAFFLPIITPGFFKSENCRFEFKQFLTVERKSSRKDLIIPIYYIGYAPIHDKNQEGADEIVTEITDRHFVDWRSNRFSAFHKKKVRREISEIAEHIRDVLERTQIIERESSIRESFFAPRSFEEGRENNPLPSHFQVHQAQPRLTLEQAMEKKQSGDYQAAKEYHELLLTEGVDWTKDIGLFVDQLYFSVSLYDKMEEWDSLNHLDKFFLIPEIKKVERILAPEAHAVIRGAYNSSMALSFLRQANLNVAYERINDAVSDLSRIDRGAAEHILYANALTARAAIQQTKWEFCRDDGEILVRAEADLDCAETIYREYAGLGQSEDFHHVGRYYGTRAFVDLSRRSAVQGFTMNRDAVLANAQGAHEGKNRTAYGRVAGRYCHALCLYQLSSKGCSDEQRGEDLEQARELLVHAFRDLGAFARLAKVKVASLALKIREQQPDSFGPDEHVMFASAVEKGRASLNKEGYGFLEKLQWDAWLATPLN